MKSIFSFFVEYFANDINSFVIVSSLFVDDNNIKTVNKKIRNMEDELIENKIVKKVSFKGCRKNCEKQYNSCLNDFSEKASTRGLLEKISYLVMADDSIDGHCFFCFSKIKINSLPA